MSEILDKFCVNFIGRFSYQDSQGALGGSSPTSVEGARRHAREA